MVVSRNVTKVWYILLIFFIKKCFCTLANVFVCLGPFNYHAILVFLQHSDLENGPEEVHCVDQVQPGPGWLHRDCCKTVGTNQGQFKQLQSQKSWPCNRKYLKSPYYVYFGTKLIVSNIELLNLVFNFSLSNAFWIFNDISNETWMIKTINVPLMESTECLMKQL